MRRIFWVLLLTTALVSIAIAQGSGTKPGPPKNGAETAKIIDINTASPEELKRLPGIGDAYAKAIAAGRPYRAKKELIQKKIIPEATYKKIQELIIAKQK